MSRSTVPAPRTSLQAYCEALGIDLPEARRASVPEALCARLQRLAAVESDAAMLAAGERHPEERIPDSAARRADQRAREEETDHWCRNCGTGRICLP